LRPCPRFTEPSCPYAAPAVVLAEPLPVAVAFVVALDIEVSALLPAVVTLLVVPRVLVPEPATEDGVPVLMTVTAEALVDVADVAVVDVAVGNCCSMTST